MQIEPGRRCVEQTLSDATRLNADGSTTLTNSVFNANGTLRSQQVKTRKPPNGLTITTARDINGDGTVDETTTDATCSTRTAARRRP